MNWPSNVDGAEGPGEGRAGTVGVGVGAGRAGGPCGGGLRSTLGMLAAALVAGLAIIASSWLLKSNPEMGTGLRALTALFPVLPFAFMFVLMVRSARRLDEMYTRIQMEALSMTVLITLVLAVAWGQLQKAGLVEKGELSAVWPVMVFVYACCFAAVMRRYR